MLAFSIVLGLVFTTGAAKLSAKQLLINQINELNFGVDQEIYNKSTGNAHYEITKMAGSLTQEYSLLRGATIDFSNQMSTPDQTGNFDLKINIDDQSYAGQVYLSEDKVIINKAVVEMIAELFPQASMGDISQYPEYLYFSREEMTSMWESMLQYRDNQAPQEIKDFLIFLVEAIPDQYFSTSLNGVTFELDQAGLEDVIYNLLIKVKDEKERFAGIIVGMSTMYGANPALDPESMKKAIIDGIDQSLAEESFPTKEQLHLMSQFVQVEDFYYHASLSPSVKKEFKLTLKISEISGFPGQITITSQTAGTKNKTNAVFNVSADIKTIDGNRIEFSFEQKYINQTKRSDSELVIAAKQSNPSTGVILFDFELKGSATQQADPELQIATPELNGQNSMDISFLMEQAAHHEQIIFVDGKPIQAGNQDKIVVFVNGKPLPNEAAPFMQDGRVMVPARTVSEALGCEVKWIEANNEILISRGNEIISMFIDKNNYTINGTTKQMDTKPILKNNYTFVPVRFVSEALNCDVKWQDPMVFITTK